MSHLWRPLIQAGVALVAAALLVLVFHKPLMAVLPAGFGLFLFITGLWFPRAYGYTDKLLRRLAHGLGVIMTWCALAPVYLIGFTLVRAWLSLTGRDPLRRARRGTTTTAWHTRTPMPRSLADYKRLY